MPLSQLPPRLVRGMRAFELDPGTAKAGEFKEGDTIPVANTAPDWMIAVNAVMSGSSML